MKADITSSGVTIQLESATDEFAFHQMLRDCFKDPDIALPVLRQAVTLQTSIENVRILDASGRATDMGRDEVDICMVFEVTISNLC